MKTLNIVFYTGNENGYSNIKWLWIQAENYSKYSHSHDEFEANN